MHLTFQNPVVRRTAERVHLLSGDLLTIEQGTLRPDAYANAPLIDDWVIGYRLEIALVGNVIGHPIVADGPTTTSGLYFLDPQLGCARTLSRWYRLGNPRG